jgi:hypothetical protein
MAMVLGLLHMPLQYAHWFISFLSYQLLRARDMYV